MGLVGDIIDRAWPVTNQLMKGHTWLYKATNGRVGHTAPGLPKMLLLDHVGAKSGTKRTSPLLYVTDGENLAIVASKGGYPKNPAWYHNLKAHPDTTVRVGSKTRAVRAREATDEEHPRLWAKAVASYKNFDAYQARTPRKRIPIIVLEPR